MLWSSREGLTFFNWEIGFSEGPGMQQIYLGQILLHDFMIVKLLLIDLDLWVARNHSAAKSAYFDWSSANPFKEPGIQDEWEHWGGGSAKSATIDLTIVLQKPLCPPKIELIALPDFNLMLHDLQDSITPFQMSCSWPLMLILVFQKLKGRPNFSICIKISTSGFAYI